MRKIALLSGLLALALPWAAQAATIVDTGAPTSQGVGFFLDGSDYLAAQFSIGAATTIDTIEGYLVDSGGMHVNLQLYTDANYAPSALLYATSFQTPGGGAWEGASGLDWQLDAGTYWVAFEPTDHYGTMPYGAPDPVDHESQYFAGRWHLTSAGVGLRILSADAAGGGGGSAAPEPAAWALMICGVGLVGVAMRQRRRPTTRAGGSVAAV